MKSRPWTKSLILSPVLPIPFPDLWDKAAALIESLIQNHPFVDGDKPSGLAAAAILLERNGYRLAADNDEVFDFTMNLARGEMRRKEINRWLAENSEPPEATQSDSATPR